MFIKHFVNKTKTNIELSVSLSLYRADFLTLYTALLLMIKGAHNYVKVAQQHISCEAFMKWYKKLKQYSKWKDNKAVTDGGRLGSDTFIHHNYVPANETEYLMHIANNKFKMGYFE